jgi:hypothetical protein
MPEEPRMNRDDTPSSAVEHRLDIYQLKEVIEKMMR